METTGRYAILRQFIADGMIHMFGNPGTVEQGFLDALGGFPELQYILTLQESVAVLCADGYARVTQKPTLVQLHSSPGIGNAVGALYQAKRGHSPLVVIAGDAGLRYMNMDAQMAADLVAIMEPVTKYATLVLDPRNLLRTLRRAIKIAATPPMGPVYVCVPADVLDAVNEEPVFPSCIPKTRVRPDEALIEQAAVMLAKAERPVIFMGDGVAWSGAGEALQALAEFWGAEIWGADSGDLNVDTTHPCYQGLSGHMFGAQSLPLTRKGDAVLIVGTYMLPEVFPELGEIFDPQAKVVHFDLNAYEIAKNHRVDLGVVCDPRCGLEALTEGLRVHMDMETRNRATLRLQVMHTAKVKTAEELRGQDRTQAARDAATMEAFAAELAQRLPEDAIVFDEALTNSPALTRAIPPKMSGAYFCTRGGSLGVGIPGAIGAKLAYPDRTVVGFSGDGGSMYTIQALYTAAKYRLDILFVICHNDRYRLLDLNIQHYWQEQAIPAHKFPTPFDLSDPCLGFVELAVGMGIRGVRVAHATEIPSALDQAMTVRGPFLIDLLLPETSRDHQAGCKCGQ
jgi:thiamine pyrophosphate-dependent acetolactate synthase large subunit-like protein